MSEASNRENKPPSIGSSLIPLINKLQDIVVPVGGELSKLSLPHVAVVGSQSSGKSSVLEALVGRDFLPRGCDICTRRPLALMLENRPPKPDGEGGSEWGQFRHLPGRRFYDFSKIRQEIQAETEREVGYNKGVSDKQICLKISSPNVLNMTLIDLPGITKVPVGDQPSDIETTIRRMIMAHICQPNCIILAVSPANSDLATSDALQIAKEADPIGSRTIGVITKLDIMDRGTNACMFLLGKVVPLRLGYVGVVNRSQEDINKNRSIQDALAYEEQFFHEHPVYNGLSDRCGIPQLAKKLNQILEQQIRTVLPGLKSDLNSHMVAVTNELRTYGEVTENKAEQGAILLNILSRYCQDFSAMVDGESQEMSTKELSGGARIRYIFQSVFVKTLEDLDPLEGLADDDIRTAIQNATGPRNALFVPEVPFEVLVKREISRLLDPCLQCLQFVHDELIMMSRACGSIELQRFPVLRRRLDDIMRNFLQDGKRPAEVMILNLIEVEMDYINSSHPSFIGGKKAVELAMQQLRSSQDGLKVEMVPTPERSQKLGTVVARPVVNGALHDQGSRPQTIKETPVSADNNSSTRIWSIPPLFRSRGSSGEILASTSVNGTLHDTEHREILASKSVDGTLHDTEHRSSSTIKLKELPSILGPLEMTENEAVEISVTKLLVRSYYDIVRKNIQDLVPKTIMHFLVNFTKRNLHQTFTKLLYRDDLVEDLLLEREEIVVKRKRAREMHHVLEEALKTLDEVQSDVLSRIPNSS
ncbi:Dynamin_N domain-containing protein/Dynamin_M domain-containing protein/GED domain-containing protein [Cephalotus follicularis]|uniref:Dynamin_N domain-containing protein/Dynamin_M domain-containing protein/GED domain-containing protein n=1 Tax=Cephalotus follicularis TaxID=3775 RepID=A0A1Q3DDL4_CEPFO|nr:Dynamin_N domain-containing protein/Dynamin_M domain-containing protein/GED domain-containing protein [Cephalotus follicularis]